DGLRCDMAMLMCNDIFARTWGGTPPAEEYWPPLIARVKAAYPEFLFIAEAYWDMEWTLQQQGFDYAYDKRLYDRLREHHAKPVREHFLAGLDYQDKLARFLENHDEPRAAATFPPGVHEAAAVLTFLSPGLRFLHQGQLEGRTKRISPHLGRGPNEPTNAAIQQFYQRLLTILKQPVLRDGAWQLLECTPGWDGNWTQDNLIAFAWQRDTGERLIVAVNYSPNQSQGHVRLPLADLAGKPWRLHDQVSGANYDWNGDDLVGRGLYLDLTPWQAAVLEPRLS
ncbi:MAG TPA: alpha-amylase, partial [Pirellulaceae bacterium]|nr:alpha-amylase [Pirellulaceae bacterium]